MRCRLLLLRVVDVLHDSAFITFKHVYDVLSECLHCVPAFKHEQGRLGELGKAPSDIEKIIRCELEETDWLIFERVDAQRDHQGFNAVVPGCIQ